MSSTEFQLPDLPADLFAWQERAQSLVRLGGFFCEGTGVAPMGSTRTWGWPDIPKDARWCPRSEIPQSWFDSPYESETFWLQLNLEEIPPQARRPVWPTQGVVWVFIDLQRLGRWGGYAIFDPRPAAEIRWRDREWAEHQGQPKAAQWRVAPTLPQVTELTFPDIDPYPDLAGSMGDFLEINDPRPEYCHQAGGWVHPIQGGFEDANTGIVSLPEFAADPDDGGVICAIDNQDFGDGGAVYLHYHRVRGFTVTVHSH